MQDRESFIFYKSFYEAIKEVEDKDKIQIYESICKYSLYEEETELTGISKILFTLIKPQLKANTKRFEDGKKGGRPKKKTTGYEKKKTTGYSEKKPNNNVNVNVNDNYNENYNVNVNDNKLKIALDNFCEMRKRIKKPLTENAKELVIKKLDSIANNEEEKIQILNNSVMNSWQGIFPLKEEKPKGISFSEVAKEMEENGW